MRYTRSLCAYNVVPSGYFGQVPSLPFLLPVERVLQFPDLRSLFGSATNTNEPSQVDDVVVVELPKSIVCSLLLTCYLLLYGECEEVMPSLYKDRRPNASTMFESRWPGLAFEFSAPFLMFLIPRVKKKMKRASSNINFSTLGI